MLAQTSYETLNVGTELRFEVTPNEHHRVIAGAQWDLAALPENSFQLLFNRDLQGAAQKLSAVEGLTLSQNDACEVYGTAGPSGLAACRMTLAAFVQEEWRPQKNFSGTAGLRFTSFSDVAFAGDANLFSALGVTPRLAVVWEPFQTGC